MASGIQVHLLYPRQRQGTRPALLIAFAGTCAKLVQSNALEARLPDRKTWASLRTFFPLYEVMRDQSKTDMEGQGAGEGGYPCTIAALVDLGY